MRRATSAAVVLGCLFTLTGRAGAANLFSVSGQVSVAGGVVPSGITARLEVDLDRDGRFSQFERLTGTVDGAGRYQLTYSLDPTKVGLQDLEFAAFAARLIADFDQRGFDALLDLGPVPIVMTFEREGYSTVVRRLGTMLDAPSLDVTMTPLGSVGCGKAGCQSADGTVLLAGFPGGTGIARAYAMAYEPSRDTSRFPGGFIEKNGSLLISSGFTEVDFRDNSGARVKSVSSPVSVAYQADPASWPTLIDLKPGTDRIELPMWSFDEGTAQWVAEADGVLLDGAGARLPETSLAAIQAGTATGPVFVGFSTQHFSTWNCDRPVTSHTCVKGRLVAAGTGTAVPGMTVSAEGVSYTGSSTSVTTATDGYFVADVMKSEAAGEDVDGNGRTGESFSVRLTATGAAGIYLGTPFFTSVENKLIGSYGTPKCRPAACDCPDLGDVIAEFETPRLCEISVHAAFSGQSMTSQSSGPLVAGDALVNAEIRGRLAGSIEVPPAASAALCAGKTCERGTSDAQGNVTFLVPVLGDAPSIDLRSEVTVAGGDAGGDQVHYYSARATVTGCSKAQASVGTTVELSYSHVSLSAVAKFIAALGSGPAAINTPDSSTLPTTAAEAKDAAQGCLCRSASPQRGRGGGAASLALLLALHRIRRRCSRANSSYRFRVSPPTNSGSAVPLQKE